MIFMLIIRKVFDIRWICINVLKNSKEEKKYICRKVFDEKNGYFIVEKKKEIKGI